MPRFAIEIAGPHNEQAIFPPITHERLRGRWDFSKVAHKNKSSGAAGECLMELSLACPKIPGLIISLDTDKGIGEVQDPLATTPDGQKIQKELKRIFDKYGNALDCGSEPEKTRSYKLDIDGVKTWAFYMKTMVDTKAAEELPAGNPLPAIDAIRKWPGRRRRDPGNTGPQTADEPREPGRLHPWADEVPVGKQKEAAGAT